MEFQLREWRPSDKDSMVEYANNPNIAKWLTNQFPCPYTAKDADDYLHMIKNDHPTKVFAITVNDKAVGSIGIFPQSDIHEKSAEIGYWLAEPYWGNGIMSKAIRQIVNYGFNTFDIIRIYARPFSTNIGSQKALEKAGLKLEAKLSKALYKNGEVLDELIYVTFKDS